MPRKKSYTWSSRKQQHAVMVQFESWKNHSNGAFGVDALIKRSTKGSQRVHVKAVDLGEAVRGSQLGSTNDCP